MPRDQHTSRVKFYHQPLTLKQSHRHTLLWFAVGISFAIVLFIWAVSFQSQISEGSATQNASASLSNASLSFQSLLDALQSGIQEVKNLTQKDTETSEVPEAEATSDTLPQAQVEAYEQAIFPEVVNVENINTSDFPE